MEINYGDRVTSFQLRFNQEGNYFYNNSFFWIHGNNWNGPVMFPANVKKISISSSPMFNSSIIMPYGVRDCYEMLKDDVSFNFQKIEFPTTVLRMAGCFENCRSFNQDVTIPFRVADGSKMFENCTNLDSVISVPSSITNAYHMFYNCVNFKGTNFEFVADQVSNALGMFDGCEKFVGENFVFNSGVIGNASGMFNACSNFNPTSPLNISENSLTDCSDIFNGCYNLNQPITLYGENCQNYQNAFRLCRNLLATQWGGDFHWDCDFKLSPNAVNCYEMFRETSFNISNGQVSRYDREEAFVIPSKVNDCTGMFQDRNGLITWVDIQAEHLQNVERMFKNCNMSGGIYPASFKQAFNNGWFRSTYEMFYNSGAMASGVKDIRFPIGSLDGNYYILCNNMAYMFSSSYFNGFIDDMSGMPPESYYYGQNWMDHSDPFPGKGNGHFNYSHMLYSCGRYNQAIGISEYGQDFSNMFCWDSNLSWRVYVGANPEQGQLVVFENDEEPDDYFFSLQGMFCYCSKYNKPFVIRDYSSNYPCNTLEMFQACSNFNGENSYIKLNSVNCHSMFNQCKNLSANINCTIDIKFVGKRDFDAVNMFNNCKLLNPEPGTFYAGVSSESDCINHFYNYTDMFRLCNNFNYNYNFGTNLINADFTAMFYDCRNLNQNIYIPLITDPNKGSWSSKYSSMFTGCYNLTNLTLDFYGGNYEKKYYYGMIPRSATYNNRLNIYVKNMGNSELFMSKIASNFMGTSAISFTGSNPWINLQYNVYVYSI